MEERSGVYRFWWGKLGERDQLEHLGGDECNTKMDV
jgi:hypothetical protein